MRAKTSVGEIEISASKIDRGEFKSQNGTIRMHSVACLRGMSAETLTGEIECNCSEPAEEYLLDCHSEQGKCTLPDVLGHGEKLLRLRSKAGAITTSFYGQNKATSC